METLDIEIETEKARKDGYATAMEEAHEAMNELLNLKYDTRKSIFGYGFPDEVVKNYDIRTIIGKLYAYEHKKTMIGKEYINIMDGTQKVIVTNVVGFQYRDKYVYYLKQNGATEHLTEKNFSCKFKETGESYPELVAFLDKAEGSES